MKIQTFQFVSVLTFYILGSLSGECAVARLLSPENGESVSQRTVLQGEFARLEESLSADEASFSRGDFDKFKGNLKRGLNCVPAPVKFRWEGEGKFLLRISKNADFSNPLIYVVKDGRGVDVYNLEIGTCYYWRVENVSGVSKTRNFATKSETPRRIKIDGLTNVRDIGGVSVGGGFKVRQGAVFRGTEFDYRLKITPEGERVFLSELGIKTDIDLRGKDELEKAGDGLPVPRFNFAVSGYHIFDGKNLAKYIEALKLIGSADRLPAYVHCWGGADRTGTFFILLESVLGYSDSQILEDFEATSLSIHGTRTRFKELKNMLAELKKYGKGSIAENVLQLLRENSMTDADFDKIRAAMLLPETAPQPKKRALPHIKRAGIR